MVLIDWLRGLPGWQRGMLAAWEGREGELAGWEWGALQYPFDLWTPKKCIYSFEIRFIHGPYDSVHGSYKVHLTGCATGPVGSVVSHWAAN